MSIPVTDKLKSYWQAKGARGFDVYIEMKRRYYNGAAMAWESSWQDVTRYLVGAPQISQQLDMPMANFFRTTTVTLTMENLNMRWKVSSQPPSIFAADDTATTGYQAYMSRVRVGVTYKFDDGTEEDVVLFSGMLSRNPRFSGKCETAELTLVGHLKRLENSDAEDVCNTFTEEATSPATGDGVNSDFLTTSEGVAYITKVEVAPAATPTEFAEVDQGDWSVSDTNTLGPAKITFDDSAIPAAGDVVRASGKKWLVNQSVADLLEDLFDNAGFSADEYQIDPVQFAGGLSGYKDVDTYSDWSASTVSGCSYEANPGYMILGELIENHGFETGDFTGWTLYEGTGCSGSVSGSSSDEGTYHASLQGSRAAGGTWTATASVGVISTVLADSSDWTDGELTVSEGIGEPLVFTLEYSTGDKVTITTDQIITKAQTITFRYRLRALLTAPEVSAKSLRVDNVRAVAITDSGTFEVPLDLLATPTAWGKLNVYQDLNGGTTTIETAASDDNINWDAFVALDANDIVQSGLKRYLKAKGTLESDVAVENGPSIDRIRVNFVVGDIPVALAIHSGQNGLAQAERYVKTADYELVTRYDGVTYVRSKSPSGSYEVHLTQDNGIIDVLDYDTGEDSRAISRGRVKYNQYSSEYDDGDSGETEPTLARRFGRQVMSDDYSDVMLANDVDLATARARAIYENSTILNDDGTRDPKVRLQLLIWFVPWLELGDVVRVTLMDRPRLAAPLAGDPLSTVDTLTVYDTPENVVALDKDFKVIELVTDLDARTSTVTLEEYNA